jgi:hypothetical protein
MTTTSMKPVKLASLGDRFAEFAVLLLAIVALAAGWALKTAVENRSQPFSSGKISAQTPVGWLTFNPGGNEVLHVSDRTAAGFGTTYLIEQEAVPAGTEPGQMVAMLTLRRGTSLTGYRVLSQQSVLVQGRKALEIDYVYVESAANLSRAVLPAVVKGKDYVFVNGGQALIVSYRAEQSVFDTDLARFYRFLVSVKF